MSWADTVRATALATLAGSTTTAAATFVSSPSTWNRNEVWIARATQPRERAPRSSVRDPAAPIRDVAIQDD